MIAAGLVLGFIATLAAGYAWGFHDARHAVLKGWDEGLRRRR